MIIPDLQNFKAEVRFLQIQWFVKKFENISFFSHLWIPKNVNCEAQINRVFFCRFLNLINFFTFSMEHKILGSQTGKNFNFWLRKFSKLLLPLEIYSLLGFSVLLIGLVSVVPTVNRLLWHFLFVKFLKIFQQSFGIFRNHYKNF